MKIKRFNEELKYDDSSCCGDGVYDITDIDFMIVEGYRSGIDYDEKKVEEFKTKYPGYCEASTYGVDGYYLLSEKPEEIVDIHNKQHPNFEGHGTLTVIDNCPRRIIILGEND